MFRLMLHELTLQGHFASTIVIHGLISIYRDAPPPKEKEDKARRTQDKNEAC
jgi:hypothetical protein